MYIIYNQIRFIIFFSSSKIIKLLMHLRIQQILAFEY